MKSLLNIHVLLFPAFFVCKQQTIGQKEVSMWKRMLLKTVANCGTYANEMRENRVGAFRVMRKNWPFVICFYLSFMGISHKGSKTIPICLRILVSSSIKWYVSVSGGGGGQ